MAESSQWTAALADRTSSLLPQRQQTLTRWPQWPKRVVLTGQLGFLFQSSSTPTGVPTDRKEDVQAEEASWGKKRIKKKKKKQLFSGWTSKLICNQTASPLPVCWDASSNIHWFQTSTLINTATKAALAIMETRLLSFQLHLDDFAVLSFGNGEKSKRCQWHLWCLEECVLVSFALCNSTWHFYYVWNQYNLLSQLGSFI